MRIGDVGLRSVLNVNTEKTFLYQGSDIEHGVFVYRFLCHALCPMCHDIFGKIKMEPH